MVRRTINGLASTSSITPTTNPWNSMGTITYDSEGKSIGNTANDIPWGAVGGSSFVPGQTPTTNIVEPLSTSDVLNARYQGAYNDGNYDLANLYKSLNKENNAYNRISNQIADYYNALAQDVAKREQGLADAKYEVARKLFDDMASQKDYVWGLYGPQGTFTKEINTYYDDMGDYLASEAGREMAYADALGVQSGASLGMMRAQRNQAYNEAFQRSLQVMQAELEAKQSIQQNLINFMTTLRQEYGDTANTYIISQYQRANDLLNTISSNIASTQANIALARLSGGGGGGNNTEGESWDELSTKQKIDLLKKNGYSFGEGIDVDKNGNLLIQNGNETLTISASDLANAGFNGVEHVRNYLSGGAL